MASSGSTGSGSPCGACKFLRRKCVPDCIFAPYFACEQGAARFAAIHKVFGASNVSKLLSHVPVADRCEAAITVAYEAQARIRDPVYGCVAHIFALQQQVAMLQAQLVQLRVQLAHRMVERQPFVNQHWQGDRMEVPNFLADLHASMSPRNSPDSSVDGASVQAMYSAKEEEPCSGPQMCTKRRDPPNELGELQSLAFKMMRS